MEPSKVFWNMPALAKLLDGPMPRPEPVFGIGLTDGDAGNVATGRKC